MDCECKLHLVQWRRSGGAQRNWRAAIAACCFRGKATIAERAVKPNGVVTAPGFDQDLGLGQGVELLSDKARSVSSIEGLELANFARHMRRTTQRNAVRENMPCI